MNLDAPTLTAIARALQLTAWEQVELFAAAAEVDSQPHGTIQDQAPATLHTLVKLISEIRLPAFVHDGYANVLAGNTLALTLLNVPEALITSGPTLVSGFNLLRFVFSPESPFKAMLGEEWFGRATSNVNYFRAASLRYRHTPRFKRILAELTAYPSFRDIWFDTQIYAEELTFEWTGYTFTHAAYGAVNFVSHISQTLTSQGALHLATFLPRNRTTAELFESIIQQQGLGVRRFLTWPYEGSR